MERGGSHINFEHQVAPGDEGENEERAAGVARRLLGGWRSRFVAGKAGGAVSKKYPAEHGGEVTLTSAADGQVDARHEKADGGVTAYQFDATSGEFHMQEQPAGQTPLPSDEPLVMQYDQLNRLLFDCDQIEARGR